jgi:hypothetical protein
MMLPTASKVWRHDLSNLRAGTVNRLKTLHLSKAEQSALAKSFFADYRGSDEQIV